MMKDIAIFGAGAYGQEVACMITKINKALNEDLWHFIGFFDDNDTIWNTTTPYGPILGGADILNSWEKPLAVAIAVANVNVLKTIVDKIVNPLIEFPNLIDPDTEFMDIDSFKIGKGNIIGHVSRMAINVQFGDFNIIVNDCVFGHDDIVGNYNVFYPAVRFSGHVTCGDCNMFGVRTTVLQGIEIGNHVKLAMGSFLLNNASDGFVYRGNPARRVGM